MFKQCQRLNARFSRGSSGLLLEESPWEKACSSSDVLADDGRRRAVRGDGWTRFCTLWLSVIDIRACGL